VLRVRDKFLILGVAVGLALTVTLVIARMGPREPVEQLAQMPVAADDVGEAQEVVAEPGMSVADTATNARKRAASGANDDDTSFVDPARRRAGRKREAEFLAGFLALRTEQGPEAFERVVREAIASRREPLSRRVAGLRALHSAGVPGTDAVLAAAVEGEADVSDGYSPSVPCSALKLLFERAPSGEDARRVLARLAFVQEARVPADLRRRASTALAASIRGQQRDEVVRLLRLETTPQQLESALEALSRDTNFGAAKPSLAAVGADAPAGAAPDK
jgi:hypothetical protein